MGITKTPVVIPTMLSALGKACARMDLTAVHDILLKTGYKDEEGAENEVSCMIKNKQCSIPSLIIPMFGDSVQHNILCLIFDFPG